MPLPFIASALGSVVSGFLAANGATILAGGAAASAAYGIAKGIKASDDNAKAKNTIYDAERLFNSAKSRYERTKNDMTKSLEELGETKLRAYANDILYFCALFNSFKNITIESKVSAEDITKLNLTEPETFKAVEIEAMEASELVKTGLRAIGAGVLAGIGSYGGAMMFASASTGTAISALSGAAATNATLAWFGGGSLAAGGFGIAGGTAALGGIVAGPAIAIMGMVSAAKAEENLSKANATYSEAENKAEKLNTASDFMSSVESIANNYNDFITAFESLYLPILRKLHYIQEKAYKNQLSGIITKVKKLFGITTKIDFSLLPKDEKEILHIAYLMTQILMGILRTSLLDKNSDICEEAYTSLESAENLIDEIPDNWCEQIETICENETDENISEKYCLETVINIDGKSITSTEKIGLNKTESISKSKVNKEDETLLGYRSKQP